MELRCCQPDSNFARVVKKSLLTYAPVRAFRDLGLRIYDHSTLVGARVLHWPCYSIRVSDGLQKSRPTNCVEFMLSPVGTTRHRIMGRQMPAAVPRQTLLPISSLSPVNCTPVSIPLPSDSQSLLPSTSTRFTSNRCASPSLRRHCPTHYNNTGVLYDANSRVGHDA